MTHGQVLEQIENEVAKKGKETVGVIWLFVLNQLSRESYRGAVSRGLARHKREAHHDDAR